MSIFLAHGSAPAFQEAIERIRSLGHRVQVAADVDKPLGDSLAGDELVLLHAVGALPAAMLQLSHEVAAKLLLLVEQPTEEAILTVAGLAPLGVVVLKESPFTTDDILQAALNRIDARPFEIDRYLDSASIERVVLTDSSKRGAALDALERFAAPFTTDARRLAQVLTIVDELTTNALYHAPVEAGRHLYSHLSRIDPVIGRSDRPVEIAFGSSGQRLVVAVRDSYGSLEQKTVLRHLARRMSNPLATFKVEGGSGPGRSRLGLIAALRSASKLVFNINPGIATECLSVFEMGGTYRQVLESGKCLQVLSASSHGV